jgi:lipoprotein NlpI
MGNLSGAITGFDKATELNPKYARAYGDRDITRLLQGKDAEAQKDLAKCFELDPSMGQVFERLIERGRKSAQGSSDPKTEIGLKEKPRGPHEERI